jgi:glutaredoxin
LVKDLKSLLFGKIPFERLSCLELKVFTLPTCSTCSAVKALALEIARKFGVDYREVDLATQEGAAEGQKYQIMGAPSIAIDDEVIVRGRFVSKERLEEEIKKRMIQSSTDASSE